MFIERSGVSLVAIGSEYQMSLLLLGDVCPDFEAATSKGQLTMYGYQGDSWLILFSHPADFTPVCTTELGMVARLQSEFAKRHCKVLALSLDSVESHRRWIQDIVEVNALGDADIGYPIIADVDGKVAALYNMRHPGDPLTAGGKVPVRTVFVIDPAHKLRMQMTYPASTGRNFNEILRVLDSLQLTDKKKVATPANWSAGDDVVILPSIQGDDVSRLFPQGHKMVKPYLRYTQV